MRANIELDDEVVRQAMKLANVRTKREAVDAALRKFVQVGNQKKVLDLFGTGGLRKNYNYKGTR